MSEGSGSGWPAGTAPPGGIPEIVSDGFGIGDQAIGAPPGDGDPGHGPPIFGNLNDLQAGLARSMGLYYSGTITDGARSYFRDVDGLTRFRVDDQLVGSVAYLPKDLAGDDAPLGAWRRVTGWDGQQQKATLEHPFSSPVQPGMKYELFRALSMDQWAQAINGAITKAWPDVWERVEAEIQVGRKLEYQLPDEAKSVLEVHSESSAYWAGYGRSLIPPVLWRMNHGVPQTLVLLRVLPGSGWKLHVAYQRQYPELEDGLSDTNLDTGFIMDQGRALAYQMLAGETQGEAQATTWTQLMMHWQERAAARRQKLALSLLGAAPVIAEGK